MTATDSIAETLDKLVEDATDHYYSPYTRFDWVDEMADDQWWMSPQLQSIAGTPHENDLDERTRMLLSKWECVNFFSLNVHGIRELLIEVTRRIHMPGFELPSEFFHRFLGEENGHMWFFAQFSLRYGNKLYPDKALRLHDDSEAAATPSCPARTSSSTGGAPPWCRPTSTARRQGPPPWPPPGGAASPPAWSTCAASARSAG